MNRGVLVLTKGWARYLLERMGFVKRKGNTKVGLPPEDFENLKEQFLFDIKSIVEIEGIPASLIFNWDQTAIKYVPVSEWTMAKEGSKKVEIAGLNDKRQITAVFAASMAGDFLPPQLVYKGTTKACLPTVEFPKGWHITCTHNHWCNESTVKITSQR